MPRFSYDALQTDGRSTSGTIDATDELQALELISSRGLTPVDVKLGTLKGPWWSREFSLSGASSVKPRDLEAFFESFATLLEAKLPLPRALTFCETQTRNHELSQTISELRSDIENGKTLGAALETQSAVIPERLQTLLRLGENSNTLSGSVARAADMLHTEAELRRELQSAMVYPVILLVMSLLVLALIVFYLAPTLSPVFETAGAEAPAVLKVMTAIRDAVSEQTLLIGGASCGILVIILVAKNQIRGIIGRLMSYLPIVAKYQNSRETLRFCQSVALMLGVGATLPEALGSAKDGTSSTKWQTSIAQARQDIEAGGRLSESLESFDAFDPMTLSLLRAGEESDSLVEMLQSATHKLQSSTKAALQQSMRLLTPSLTLIIGGMVGFLIISTISAILDLNDIAF